MGRGLAGLQMLLQPLREGAVRVWQHAAGADPGCPELSASESLLLSAAVFVIVCSESESLRGSGAPFLAHGDILIPQPLQMGFKYWQMLSYITYIKV